MKENLKEVYTQRTDSCDMANSVEFTALMNMRSWKLRQN